ncbi:hypothetical protein QZH41_010834 [Actinostola sp. cb2023]|nr:hypothetical protein QZH41_010834 [Actinostola sp. cb2023]
MVRYRIDLHRNKKKEQTLQQVRGNSTIQDLDKQLTDLDKEIERKQLLLRAKSAKSRRLDTKIEQVVRDIEELDEIGEEVRQDIQGTSQNTSQNTCSTVISEKSKIERSKNPVEFCDGKLSMGVSAGRKRRSETFQAAEDIYGGTKRAATIGLIDTVLHRCSQNVLAEVMSTRKQMQLPSMSIKKI